MQIHNLEIVRALSKGDRITRTGIAGFLTRKEQAKW